MIKEFWPWFLAKDGRRVGYKLLATKWLFLDAGIAASLTFGLNADGFAFAEKALFPAASILVGMAVAWTARAFLIVNDESFQEKVLSKDQPIEDYIYGYQMSIMILFTCIGYIAIMAAGGFKFFVFEPYFSRLFSSFFMFWLISLSVRECWSIVNFTSLLAILDNKTRN